MDHANLNNVGQLLANAAEKYGDRVAVAPDDYGRDWVEGDLVIANAERIIIARSDARADHVHVHFPRVGYILRAA